MLPWRNWRLWAVGVALLAYPRAFRCRFGDEVRADIERDPRIASPTQFLAVLATHIRTGLAERGSAVVRWLWWPTHNVHLYEPSGRRAMLWDSLRSDIRFTLRQARRAPAFTCLAVLALALGIGANSAVFSVVNGVLLRPLPYQEPEQLVMVWSDNRNEGRALNVVSPANFADYRDRARTFAAMDYAVSFMMRLTVKGEEDAPPTWALRTGSDLFNVLGRQAMLGRVYTTDERRVAVVSHAYWTNRLGSDPSAIGRSLTLSGNEVVTIVGVMPPDFAFPYRSMFGPWVSGGAVSADMWIPMPFEGSRWVTAGGSLIRNVHSLVVVGRLAPGVSPDEARADLGRIGLQLEAEYPESNRGWGTTVVSLMDQTVGSVKPALIITLAGVGLLLLMATVNVANLVLARSVARQRELAVRAALGASRMRLARQSLTEGVILSLAGASLGLLFVRWGVEALVALAPIDIPRMQDVSPDVRVVAVTVIVGVGTGLLIGLLPTLSSASADTAPALQDHSRGTVGSRSRRRLRSTLVVVEVALAVVLAVAAGLLIRSFTQLMNVDPGFRPESLLTLQMNLPDRLVNEPNRPVSAEQRRAFYEDLLDRLEAIPSVLAVGGTTRIPLGSSSVTTSLQVEGREMTGQLPEVEFRRVMRDFFPAMGTPLMRGRLFGSEDGPTAASAAVINHTLARRIFGQTDPIGQHIRSGPAPSGPWLTIVGVVGDMRHASLDVDPLPELYLDYAGSPPNSPFIAIRTSGEPTSVVAAVRREARELDAAAALYDIRPMESIRAASVAERRFLLILITAFGLLALLLASVGVYGVMMLVVSERTQEVGVRLALGAEPSRVLGMIVRQAMTLAVVGVTIGLASAAVLAPLLTSQLFGVAATDPATFVAVPALLTLVAVAAAVVPGRRAMRIDPVQAMRYE